MAIVPSGANRFHVNPLPQLAVASNTTASPDTASNWYTSVAPANSIWPAPATGELSPTVSPMEIGTKSGAGGGVTVVVPTTASLNEYAPVVFQMPSSQTATRYLPV